MGKDSVDKKGGCPRCLRLRCEVYPPRGSVVTGHSQVLVPCHSLLSLIACSGEDAGLSSATPSPIEQRAPSPGGATGVPHSYLCVPVQFAQALPGAAEGQVAPAPASSAPGV